MNQNDAKIHCRRNIRLSEYDYSQQGLYFVTICVQNHECFFGEIVNENMSLNPCGEMIVKWVAEIENKFTDVKIISFIVMPNHFHGILEITRRGVAGNAQETCNAQKPCNITTETGVARNAPTGRISPKSGTLSAIIRAYKSAVTKSIHKINVAFAWQRNYYEHIIRNEEDYLRIAEYINNNAAKWHEDRYYC